MKKFTKIVFVILVLCAFSLNSSASLITIGIEARVNYLNDSNNLLQGKVSVGSKISGTYTYDTNTPDTNPVIDVGDYLHYTSPCGVSLTVGGITFKSNLDNTMFKLGVTNGNPGIARDSYGIRSFYNSLILDGIQVDELSWALLDFSGTALSSADLPTTAPVLSDWGNDNTLYLGGGIGGTPPCYTYTFSIGAEVTSAFLIPEPASLLIFSFGLLMLRKKRL
jgi:hypothetical protein